MKAKIMKRNSGVCGFGGAGSIALLFFILSSNVLAGMAVSPLQQRVVVKPGRKATFSITLTNNNRGPGSRPCPISVEVVDFAVSDRGKLSFGQEQKHSRSAVDWISFEENEFVLELGESRKMKATVTVPMNADGDYWAAVMVRLGKFKEGEKGVQVRFRTASGVFIHVARRNYIERGSVIDANVALPEFDPRPCRRGGVDPNENLAEEPNEGQASQQEQTLKINAELKNDGLIAFLARGKAYLYSDGWRRIATIPLYSNRRRVLPGDTRWFTGIMAQPLPAGQYKLRVFFAADSKYGRKITRDMEFSISEDLARKWAENFVSDDGTQTLKIKPQQIELKLTPGRLTTTRFKVANKSLGTVVTSYRVESKESHKDWLELKTTDFAFAPNTERSMTCLVKVPSDTQPGQYDWTIHVDAERSGLTSEGQSNIKQYQIPVRIVVRDIGYIIAGKEKRP